MNKVIYLSRFIQELETEYQNILNYTQSQDVAKNIHNEILDDIDRLEILPQIGQIERDIKGKMFRSLIVLKNYKVYYFIESNNVYIFSLWNCRRDPKGFKI